jgi:hypothetical protein
MRCDLTPSAHGAIPFDSAHGTAVVEERAAQRDDARLLGSVLQLFGAEYEHAKAARSYVLERIGALVELRPEAGRVDHRSHVSMVSWRKKMTIALTPLVVAIIGLLMWFFVKNAKLSEAGRILFFVGSLAFVMVQGAHTASFQIK